MARTYTNRLADESSPYLRQHADNPVDWYSWSEEAFKKARRENKPIFLSIGYSSCHWCHVMAHESFENEQVASVLNSFFVSIKVDREERPDIDSVYMDIAQAMNGSGGWPLSIFMTPDKKPFFAGTYFPPKDIGNRPGFVNLLLALHDAWMQQREQITHVSDQAIQQFAENVVHQRRALREETVTTAFGDLERSFDHEFGGFGRAPKFPQPSLLSFLLVYHHRSGAQKALTMVERTLQAMAAGGIYDHLGGGFHRYCVDRHWQVPHFEKMLYDQALIGRAYLQAFQVTGREMYADTARGILEYVLRDLTDPGGGFYSSEDADSEGQEGRFYLWDYDDIFSILGPEDGQVFAACYGIRPEGNFEGRNILYRVRSAAQAGEIAGVHAAEAERTLESCRQKLLEVRSGRIRPARDEKIIAGWNGLMISALARGAAILHEPRYLQAAERAAHVAIGSLIREGRLRRSFAEGQAVQPGFLEDYAFLAQGLIDLYQAGFAPKWLSEAIFLADQMIELFADRDNGGFYFAGSDAEELLFRQKPHYDGATPAGNSAAAVMLQQLASLTGRNSYLEYAQNALEYFAPALEDHGSSMAEMLIGADFSFGPRQEIVIAGASDDLRVRRLIERFYSRFLPRTVLMLRTGQSRESLLDEINPFLREQGTINGTPAAYVCENYACKEPVTGIEQFETIVNALK